jgi:hypothetical protein
VLFELKNTTVFLKVMKRERKRETERERGERER